MQIQENNSKIYTYILWIGVRWGRLSLNQLFFLNCTMHLNLCCYIGYVVLNKQILTNKSNGFWKEHGKILRPVVADWNLHVFEVSISLKGVWHIGCDIEYILDAIFIKTLMVRWVLGTAQKEVGKNLNWELIRIGSVCVWCGYLFVVAAVDV